MTTSLAARWTSSAWRTEVESWIETVLTRNGVTVTGPIEQPRLRCWSTQLTVPTSQGVVWFKENNPGQAFEAALVAELARLAPDHVVPPLAVDGRRGWLLTADQGSTLGTLKATDKQVWARVVGDFAELQRRTIDHESELLSSGLPQLPPSACVAFVARSASQLAALPAGDPRHAPPDLVGRVDQELPVLAEKATALAQGPVSLALEHNDLHHYNAFLPAAGDSAPLRFFDFGDALWAHPFTTLRITLNVVTGEWDCGIDDPRVTYIVDAYLEHWTDKSSRQDLLALLDAALAFGPAHRFASWLRILEFADPDVLAEYGETLPRWLDVLTTPYPALSGGSWV